MKPRVLAMVVAGVLVVGGGAFALTRFVAPAEDEAVSIVPANSVVYGNLFIQPSNSQKGALDDLLQRFPGIDGADEAIERIIESFDESLGEDGLSFEEDIEPWLGDQIGFFVAPPQGDSDEPPAAVMIESTDDEAALAAIEKAQEADTTEEEYEGVTYYTEGEGGGAFGFVGGFLVAGTEDGFRASVDASTGEGLEGSETFTRATDPLRDDWLGLFYVDGAGLVEAIEEAGGLGPSELASLGALGFDEQSASAGVLYVTGESIVLETSGGLPSEGSFAGLGGLLEGSGVLEELPGEAWAAFGFPDLGGTLSALLDTFASTPGFDRQFVDQQVQALLGIDLEDDLLSWMGDTGLFVQGTSVQEIGGGIVVESSDPAKTEEIVAIARRLLQEQGLHPSPASRGDLAGFSIQMPGVPAPVYVLGGDRLLISYGESATDDAVGAAATLGDSEAFHEAHADLGDEFEPSFYLSIDAAQQLGETFLAFAGEDATAYEEDVKPYLDPFAHVIAGVRTEGDSVVQKIVVGVR